MKTQLQKEVSKNTKKEYNKDILEMYKKNPAITLLLNLKKYLENCNL